MRRFILNISLLLLGVWIGGRVDLVRAMDFGPRAMSGSFNVTTPEGWRGRRYMDGEFIFAEEFDSNGDKRIDVWRFYHRGILSSEERDLNYDGRVDCQTRWDGRTGNLLSILRDTNFRGINDMELEYKGGRNWELREDRNLDGVTDSILYFNAPPGYFDELGSGMVSQGEVASLIPRDLWRELHVDEGFGGSISTYYRFSRGQLAQRGEFDGRRMVWRRVPPGWTPDLVPPPDFGHGDQVAEAPAPRRPSYRIPLPDYARPIGPEPMPGGGTIRNPFDFSASGGDADPYAGLAPPRVTRPPRTRAPAPAVEPEVGAGYGPPPAGGRVEYGSAVPPAGSLPGGGGSGSVYVPPARRDGLPPGESSARSVPARMRPPGQEPARRTLF